jgi:hypothetical protein
MSLFYSISQLVMQLHIKKANRRKLYAKAYKIVGTWILAERMKINKII